MGRSEIKMYYRIESSSRNQNQRLGKFPNFPPKKVAEVDIHGFNIAKATTGPGFTWMTSSVSLSEEP